LRSPEEKSACVRVNQFRLTTNAVQISR
jgi:hypothetical protein